VKAEAIENVVDVLKQQGYDLLSENLMLEFTLVSKKQGITVVAPCTVD
jgi:hypothetical protein